MKNLPKTKKWLGRTLTLITCDDQHRHAVWVAENNSIPYLEISFQVDRGWSCACAAGVTLWSDHFYESEKSARAAIVKQLRKVQSKLDDLLNYQRDYTP